MSKERLEEIDRNKEYIECGLTGDLLGIELNPNDYYELLEQAEQAHELERRNRTLSDNHFQQLEQYRELVKQNKRYREALEKIARRQSNTVPKIVIVKHQIIARKALEESK